MGKEKSSEEPDVSGDMQGFILDLIRLKREKALREKKDNLINEMAMEQKRKMEEAKHSSGGRHSYSSGGFVGIQQLTRGSSSNWSMNKNKLEEDKHTDNIPATGDKELIILGMMRDKEHEKHAREHQVYEEEAGCASQLEEKFVR